MSHRCGWRRCHWRGRIAAGGGRRGLRGGRGARGAAARPPSTSRPAAARHLPENRAQATGVAPPLRITRPANHKPSHFPRQPAPNLGHLCAIGVVAPQVGGHGPRRIERAEVCVPVLAKVRRLGRTGRRSRSRAASSSTRSADLLGDRIPPGSCVGSAPSVRGRNAECCRRPGAREAAPAVALAELLRLLWPSRPRGCRASFVKRCA